MDKKILDSIVYELLSAVLSKITEIAFDDSLQKIRDELFLRRIITAFVSRLVSGYHDFEEAEAERILVIDKGFFLESQVKIIITNAIFSGDLDEEALRRRYISFCGAEEIELFNRNLSDAWQMLEKTVEESLPPEERAAFARLRQEFALQIKNLQENISLQTQSLLNGQEKMGEQINQLTQVISGKAEMPQPPFGSLDVIKELSGEYKAQLDQIQALISQNMPSQARKLLVSLRERAWENMSVNNKYQLLAYSGLSYLRLEEYEEANQSFLEALQFKPERSMALANAALGSLVTKDFDRAKNFAEKALASDPTNYIAYSYIIHSYDETVDFKKEIEKIPDHFKNKSIIAQAIGHLAFRMGLESEAEEWYRKSIITDQDERPEIRALLAELLLSQIMKNNPMLQYMGFQNPFSDQAKEIIELYDFAWGKVCNTDVKSLRVGWLANRGVAKALLDNVDGAISDLDEALMVLPNEPIIKKSKGIVKLRNGDLPSAAKIFRSLLDDPNVPEAKFWMGVVLLEDKRFSEASDVVSNLYYADDIDIRNKLEAGRLLILIKIQLEDLSGAEEIIKEMLVLDPENICVLSLHARINWLLGNRENTRSILANAKKLISKGIDYTSRFWLADEFFRTEDFSSAAEILEEIVDLTVDKPPVRQLVSALYNLGKLDKALAICKSIRQQFGSVEYLTQIEVAIYLEVEDYVKARDISTRYLEKFPNNPIIWIRLAVSNYQLGDMKAVDDILNRNMDLGQLALQEWLIVANLLIFRRRFPEAIDLLYEARRKFITEQKAHVSYIQPFLMLTEEEGKWLNPDSVGKNSAVKISRPGGVEDRWIIIEDREVSNPETGEYSLEHPIAKLLIGKKVGDKVNIPQGLYPIEAEIVSVTSKYVMAYNETFKDHEIMFPNSQAIFRIPVNYGGKDNVTEAELVPTIKAITDIVDSRNSFAQQVEEQYRQGKLTIGALSEIMNVNPISAIVTLSGNRKAGIHCCNGDFAERKEAFNLLSDTPKLIVDISAIISIYQLRIGDAIIQKFGKLYIANTTLSLFDQLLNTHPFNNPGEFMQIVKEGEDYKRLLISEEIVQREKEEYETAYIWVKENCEVMPIQGALEIGREKREQMDYVLGQSFADTVLIAINGNLVLYSDDYWFRRIANNEHQLSGVWTQSILQSMLDSGHITIEEYRKSIITLANMNYHHTSINSEIILEAAKAAKWVNRPPLSNMLLILSGEKSDLESAIEVSANFIHLLRREKLMVNQHQDMINSILDTLCMGRGNRQQIMNALRNKVKARFFIDEIGFNNFDYALQIWKARHVL